MSYPVYPKLPSAEEDSIMIGKPGMDNFHTYASLKTTGQLVMDIGSLSSHLAVLVAFLKNGNTESTHGQIFLWSLVTLMIFQAVVAFGLFLFRRLNLDDENNHSYAHKWNIVFFVSVFLISISEAALGVFEKFGIDHGHGVNGTTGH